MNKIVFTNGCFDLLHIGHTRLLKFARECGDHLIVGLNSDDSIRGLKGEPIVPEEQRREMLEAIRWVDEVIIFSELTPFKLIEILKPDVLVKGADHKHLNIIGAGLVSEVKLFPTVQCLSTGQIKKEVVKHGD